MLSRYACSDVISISICPRDPLGQILLLLSLFHWGYESYVAFVYDCLCSLTQKIASANDSVNYLDNVKKYSTYNLSYKYILHIFNKY